MLLEDAVRRTPLLDLDGDGCADHHLHQGAVRPDEVAALANRGAELFMPWANCRLGVVGTDRLRLAVIDGFRKMEDRGRERLVEIDARARQAGVGLVRPIDARRSACSPSTISGRSAKYRLIRIAPSSSVAARTSARSSHALFPAASPSWRFRKKRMSTTTSVPPSARKLPSGRRIAPTRSAIVAMCSRAEASTLSIVPEEVTKAASPPVLRHRSAFAMK